MNKLLAATALTAGLFTAHPAAWAEGGYIGLQHHWLDMDYAGNMKSLDPKSASLVIGGSLSPQAHIEARLGRSTEDDTGNGSLAVDDMLGVYLKLGPDLNQFFPYVMAGVTKAEIEFPDGDTVETESGLSLGFGADVMLGPIQIGAEWARLLDENDRQLNAATLTTAWRF